MNRREIMAASAAALASSALPAICSTTTTYEYDPYAHCQAEGLVFRDSNVFINGNGVVLMVDSEDDNYRALVASLDESGGYHQDWLDICEDCYTDIMNYWDGD